MGPGQSALGQHQQEQDQVFNKLRGDSVHMAGIMCRVQRRE